MELKLSTLTISAWVLEDSPETISPELKSMFEETFNNEFLLFHLITSPDDDCEFIISPSKKSFVLNSGVKIGRSFSGIILPAELIGS